MSSAQQQLDLADEHEHICDATINPCSCGRRWEFSRRYSNGRVTYTSKQVVDRYHALYGAPEIPFEACEFSRSAAAPARAGEGAADAK
jgi:hypothetical protein